MDSPTRRPFEGARHLTADLAAASIARVHCASVWATAAVLITPWTSLSCVPEGPATEAAPPSAATIKTQPGKPSADSINTPSISSVFEDSFDRVELGSDWNALSPKWKIAGGRLCVRDARNRGVWLLRRLPVNAIIEFDAIAEADDGDLKAELWGDGKSGATATSYTNATSYLAILGGWKNSKHVLARLDEHGDNRLELDVDPNSDDDRARAVEPGQPYHFRIERTDGKTIAWYVNDTKYFEFIDSDPLAGQGHEHLGFNNWEAPVCFDNVRVTPL